MGLNYLTSFFFFFLSEDIFTEQVLANKRPSTKKPYIIHGSRRLKSGTRKIIFIFMNYFLDDCSIRFLRESVEHEQ